MINQIVKTFHGGWMLLRLIAVISSSIATILSSLLPLFLYTSISKSYLFMMLIFLSLAAVIIHGMLTHLLNDYVDDLSGTDARSPAILSGGSRVIQKGVIRPQAVWKIGKWLTIILLAIAVLMSMVGQVKLTILIIIGVWAAVSYSLPPLRLSYHPFLGEWLSLFPAIFFLGLAGPWLVLETIPLWAVQNAVINALVCMAWVMVHHIPDVDADRMATPIKQTTVVWFVNRFGLSFASCPALLYMAMAGLFAVWLFSERFLASLIVIGILLFAFTLVMKMDVKNNQQVSNYEKILLLIAIMIAIVLGVF